MAGAVYCLQVDQPCSIPGVASCSLEIHNVFHTSLFKLYMSNGEAVDLQSFTLIGWQDDQFEVERIVDFSLMSLHKIGKPRKINELIYWVQWRGVAYGIDARQPYQNVKPAQAALQDMACRYKLPPDLFAKDSNRLPMPASTAASRLYAVQLTSKHACKHALHP